MSFFALYASDATSHPQPQQFLFNLDHHTHPGTPTSHIIAPETITVQQPQPQHYGSVNFDAHDSPFQVPIPSWQDRFLQHQHQNVSQPVSVLNSAESSLARALDDLHVTPYPQGVALDPNTFYEYREVLRHSKANYRGNGTMATFPVVDEGACMYQISLIRRP